MLAHIGGADRRGCLERPGVGSGSGAQHCAGHRRPDWRGPPELLLVTYSARPYQPIIEALTSSIARGVDVVVLVETLQGAAGLLAGPEPASAFRDVPGVRLWHWPTEKRTNQSARMHAKLAVADRRVLFASSVNLTQSGVEHSMEAGVLVRGGTAPVRAAEHIDELRARGILGPLAG